jgi:hypothetical protein
MWVVHHLLALAALYGVIITGIYFAQTWLLFPTALAGEARSSTSRIDPASSRSKSSRTKGSLECQSRLRERRRMAGRRFWTLAGTPGTPKRWPSPCTRSFHTAMPSLSTTAAIAKQPQAERAGAGRASGRRPSERTHYSDSLVISDHLVRRSVGGPSFRSASASSVQSPPI